MTMSLMSYIHTPIISSMNLHRVNTITAMKLEIQSRKLIKPSVSTPLTLRHYKISLIDEFAPTMNLPLVLFFPPSLDNNPTLVVQLEESLKKTLTNLYPLAGRYMEDIHTVDCNDQGVEFIQARADITIQELLIKKTNLHLVNELIPSKLLASDLNNAMLATQVTTFQCGGLALGVSSAHRIGDVSTMITFLNQWATLTHKDTKLGFGGIDFTSSSMFPAQGLLPLDVGFRKLESNGDYVTKKLSFDENAISNMKTKVTMNGKGNTHQLFKVRLVSPLICKAFIGVDYATYGDLRTSVLVQPVALRQKREKIASLNPKSPLGNHWGLIVTESGTTKEFENLTDLLVGSVTKTIKDYSKVGHDSSERKQMVLNSFSDAANIPDTTNVTWLASWCKFPFYNVNFGFGKPLWVGCGFVPFKRGMMLLDDAKGNGVEAYVTMGVKDVPYFEQDDDIKAFAT
ncbi:putative transferase [Helianthus debilis subsp. tardiflorus]